MDKRTVFGFFACDDGKFMCGNPVKCLTNAVCEGCTEYALVNPQELATLESQLATANEACAAKDAAIQGLLSVLDNNHCNSDDCSDCNVDDSCDLNGDECAVKQARLDATAALSQTPAAVARLAEDAAGFRRVKELVTDIRERLTRQNCEPISILTELDNVIAQAKAGEG